jgi:CheY-like chemotaxis protein
MATPAQPIRVLIVEDNWLIALEAEAVLQDAGYQVLDIAVSAEEALAACAANRPDVVLMDIRLLGQRDGIDAAIEIRERFGVPSVFVTAHDDPDIRARAEAAHPIGWILKPIAGSKLSDSLARIMGPPGAA